VPKPCGDRKRKPRFGLKHGLIGGKNLRELEEITLEKAERIDRDSKKSKDKVCRENEMNNEDEILSYYI
jgi:hypothetical protein